MAMMSARYGQNGLGTAIQVIGPDGLPSFYSDCGSMESGSCDQQGLPGGTVVTQDTSYFPTTTDYGTVDQLPLGGSFPTGVPGYNAGVAATMSQAVNKFNLNTMSNGAIIVLALVFGFMMIRK